MCRAARDALRRPAAAAIRRIETELERGNLLRSADVIARFDRELCECKALIVNLSSRFGPELIEASADVESILIGAVDEAVSALRADDPATWPTPRPAPEDYSWLDVVEARDVLPLLAVGDPRYEYSKAPAESRELELEELQATVVPLALALEKLAEQCIEICGRFRAIGLLPVS